MSATLGKRAAYRLTGLFGPARGGAALAVGPRLFFWPELRARDAAAAQQFYASVLECTLEEVPGESTAMLRRDDRTIGAVTALAESERAASMTDHWRLYLVTGTKVSNTKVSNTKVSNTKVSNTKVSSSKTGPRAVLERLPGARRAATQAAAHFGRACEPGAEAVLWAELARAEHEGLAESELARAAMLEAMVYAHLASDDDDASGGGRVPRLFHNEANGAQQAHSGVLIGPADPSSIGGMSVSNVCLTVDDCEGALRRARAAGGTIVGRPSALATGGRLGAVIDPQGAAFFCWQPSAAVRFFGPRSRAHAAVDAAAWPAASQRRITTQ